MKDKNVDILYVKGPFYHQIQSNPRPLHTHKKKKKKIIQQLIMMTFLECSTS